MQALVLSPASLGRALRDARLARGLTQGQLSQRAGVSQPTISSVERGASNVSLDTLLRLVATLRLEILLRSREPGHPKQAASNA